MKEPDTHPKGDGHHYHKHKDHTPAAQNASFWVLPDLIFAIGTRLRELAPSLALRCCTLLKIYTIS
jgi:hypothetical protein